MPAQLHMPLHDVTGRLEVMLGAGSTMEGTMRCSTDAGSKMLPAPALPASGRVLPARCSGRQLTVESASRSQGLVKKASLVVRALVSTANGASGSAAAQEQRRRPDYVPNRIDDPSYVRIFDTTLRDGEQSPGATMTSKEKLEIARQLAKLGVDIIEAGFPAASPDDFEAVRSIAMDVGNAVDADGYVPVICGLSRAVPRRASPHCMA